MDTEAEFWKMKYFEQLSHSTQIIAQLMGPELRAKAQTAVAAMQAKQNEQKNGKQNAAQV